MSFAARLLEWLLTPLLFLWLFVVGIMYVTLNAAANESFDVRLADLARAVAARVVATGDPRRPVAISPSAIDLIAADREDEVSYALRRTNGEWLAGNADVPPVSGAIGSREPKLHSGVLGDELVRVASIVVPDPSRTGQRIVVQVAETLNKRQHFATSLHAQALLPQLIVLFGAVALIWYGVVYVVAPMRQIRSQIDRREAGDLAPLPEGAAPRELAPLIASINNLMARLAANLDTQQRFVADAAHQLRTPLAALKSQTELAIAERDPAALRGTLLQLEAATERTAHLANRLLVLARAGAPRGTPIDVDLARVASEAVADAVPRAVERRIDLGLERGDGAATVKGDPLMLRELCANLIDNALTYTPPGGTVTVRVAGGRSPSLAVADSGCGIAPAERERVLQPFYRASDNTHPGTGLGLAIVDEIARGHRATVAIGDGPGEMGTTVRIDFPRDDVR
jgi:two-component system sensor histidine kinase TctE